MLTLNSSFLFYKLSESCRLEQSSESFSVPVFSVTLYSPLIPLKSGYVYLFSRDEQLTDFSFFPQDSLIICERHANAPSLPNIWFLKEAISTASLLQRIQEILINVQNWHFQIFNLRFQKNSLQKILESSVLIFDHPLMIMNMNAQILGYCPKRGQHSFRTSGLPYAYLPDMAASIKFNMQQNQEQEHDPYYFSSTLFENRNLLCVNIKINGLTEYRLILLDCKERYSDIFGPLLLTLADVLKEELNHRPQSFHSKDRRLHVVFEKILSGQSTDYVRNSQILEELGWSSSDRYSVMLILSAYLDPQSKAQASICRQIESLSPAALCSFLFQEQMVTFINHSLLTVNFSSLQAQFSTIIRDNLLKAAYSRVLLGHFNFYRQYKQAKMTLLLGERLAPTLWIYRFNDFAFEYICSSITKSLPAYMIAHEKLLAMKYFDEQHKTHYYDTLRKYLDNQMNAAKTAKDLYIHRSTFLHRLEKIKEILHSSLDDSEEILYLMISFRLNDREEKHSSAETKCK